jgi:hypothetical protein
VRRGSSPQSCASLSDGPPMDDVGLGGGHRVMGLVEGKDMAEGTHDGACRLMAEGQHPVNLGTKVDDGPAD